MTEKIDKFRGEHRWLSNFWPANVSFEGIEYDCVEKAYVAAKFPKEATIELKVDGVKTEVNVREYLRDGINTPGGAKRLGRKAEKAGLLRSDWNEVKLEVMRQLIAEKFGDKNPHLVVKLLETGEAELIEGNTWGDTYWGVVTGGRSKSKIGQGQNHLGKLLMERRTLLRKYFEHLAKPEVKQAVERLKAKGLLENDT